MRAHQANPEQGERRTAVVVGASVAGLCAARVLSSRFAQVIVFDRDTLPAEPRWRGQVPQGRQPHLLLVSGARLLEQQFPGIGAELLAQGAIEVDVCGDFYWFQSGGAARRPASSLRGPAPADRITGVVGDAVCSFDPIYGQGVTSAAQQAEALGASLDRSPGTDRSISRRYFRAASRIVASPWSIAVGGDFAYPGTTGRKPAGTDLFNRYWDRMMIAWQHDDEIVVRANEVMALLRSPGALLTPPFIARVLRTARRGPVG